jgi:hypothetical protein
MTIAVDIGENNMPGTFSDDDRRPGRGEKQWGLGV